MSKTELNNYEGQTILIRNMEASLIYKISVDQNENHRKLVDEYKKLKTEISELGHKKEEINKQIKAIIDSEGRVVPGNEESYKNLLDEIKSVQSEINQKQEDVKDKFDTLKLDETKNCNLKGKNKRYYYKGNLTDSLMRRKLVKLIAETDTKDSFVIGKTCGFSEVIVNVAFSKDYMTPDEHKKGYYRKTIGCNKLRDMFYETGIWLNGIHYVQFERSSSKARVGDCLFIQEKYYNAMIAWVRMGLNFKRYAKKKDGSYYKDNRLEKIDITGERSYESLTSSSIICTVDIDPYSILLIDDVSGEYTMPCNVVESVERDIEKIGKNGNIITVKENVLEINEKNHTEQTDLWDGQSLLDSSVFDTDKLRDKGFLLLRNHFLKTAGFNTKLKEWYQSEKVKPHLIEKDGVFYVEDRFGNLLEADKIKMVTTKNSVKIFKEPFVSCILFDELGKTEDEVSALSKLDKESLVWDWYRKKVKEMMGDTFGVCKFEKPSKIQGGEYQQFTYQGHNSLRFSYKNVKHMCRPQAHEIMLMKNNVAFFKDTIDTRSNNSARESMLLAMLEVNDDVQGTKLYKDFRNDYIKTMKNRICGGKIFMKNSDYCVLFGNPYEMLLASAGMLKTHRSANGKIIADSSIMDNPEHDKKKQFECYCSKYEDGKELFGFRSPHICEGNVALFINVKHPEYEWFNFNSSKNIIAVSFFGYGAFLSPKLNGCDVDSDAVLMGDDETVLEKVRLAQEKLIPINGLSPFPKALAFTDANMASTDTRLATDFIGRICNFAQNLQSYYWHIWNVGTEEQKQYLDMIYDDICILEVLSNIAIDQAKRDYPIDLKKEMNRLKNRSYLIEKGAIIDGESIQFEHDEKTYYKIPTFMKLNTTSQKKKVRSNATDEEKQRIKEHNQKVKELESLLYYDFVCPMNMVRTALDELITKADDVPDKQILEILNRHTTQKADKRKMDKVVELAIEYSTQIYLLGKEYKKNGKNGEQYYEGKIALEKQAIEDISKISLSVKDIVQLICKVYDVRDKKDTNGKIIKENGIDNREKRLADYKAGNRMLQWVYKAHEDTFIKAIKTSSCGTVSNIREVSFDYEPGEGQNIFERYGKRYIIA